MILPNPYVKIPRCFAPCYVPGDTYTLYINFDTPPVNMDETQYKIGLLTDNVLIQNVSPLLKDALPDGGFNLYALNFTFPAVRENTYRFVVYNINTLEVIARSNLIQVNPRQVALCTLVEANNGTEDIYNFGFSRVEGLVLSQLVPLFQTNQQPETDSKVYRNVTNVDVNRWRNLGSYEDDVYSAEVYYMDNDGHSALRAMLNMQYVYFNHRRVQYKAGTYKIDTIYNLNVSKATFDFYAMDEYNAVVSDTLLPSADLGTAYYS